MFRFATFTALAVLAICVPAAQGEDLPGVVPGPGVEVSSGSPTVAAQYGSGAYVQQVGDDNTATVGQADPAFTRIAQFGDGNIATVTQEGSAYADWRQAGGGNTGSASQSGADHNTLIAVQHGDRNWAVVQQTAVVAANGAAVQQTGHDNRLLLVQGEGDNHATLAQNGNGNDMSVSQSGGAILSWTQNGDNLASLGISQSGGQAVTVTQHRP